jgi:hypothetical protein
VALTPATRAVLLGWEAARPTMAASSSTTGINPFESAALRFPDINRLPIFLSKSSLISQIV